jgi:hypothetical protein
LKELFPAKLAIISEKSLTLLSVLRIISKKNIIFATVKNSEHDKKNYHLLLAMLHECSNNTGTRTDRQRWNKGQ